MGVGLNELEIECFLFCLAVDVWPWKLILKTVMFGSDVVAPVRKKRLFY